MVWYWMVRSHFAIWKLDQNCTESQKLFPVFKCSGRSKTGHRKSCFYESRFQVSGIHFVTVYVLQVSWSTSLSLQPLKYLSHTQVGKNVGLLYVHLLCVMSWLKVSSQQFYFVSDSADRHWVGMWWGGFLICGACLLVIAIPFFFYPKELKVCLLFNKL